MELRRQTETGNGDKLKNIIKHNLVATNTLYNPQSDDNEKLITWISSDNNIKQQLDYITISQKHKQGK